MSLANFHKWPHFDEADIAAVTDVLKSAKVNRWTGTKNLEFEQKLCELTKTEYSIALANGTVAIELALYAFGIGEGDEVITTCRTFMASASSVVMRGARPIVADIDPISQNVSAKTIEACITSKTKAIIAVHLAGWPCEMDGIMDLAKKHHLYVIEDCAQAHGAKYREVPVGGIGHIGAWSFCQDKIITTCGEGGAVTTNDEALWRKMWEYKDHGKSYDAIFNKKHPEGFRWLIESFGTNWRLSEMQCAQGILWLEKLDEWVEKRRSHAAAYNKFFEDFDCIKTTIPQEHIYHSYYKYYCFIRPEKLKPEWTRDRIAKTINSLGVPCFSGSCWNISEEKCFKDKGWDKNENDLPNAAKLRDTSLMLLTHPTLENEDVLEACNIIKGVLKEASI